VTYPCGSFTVFDEKTSYCLLSDKVDCGEKQTTPCERQGLYYTAGPKDNGGM